MKILFLSFCLILAVPNAFAALCSKAPKGVPCTPDPNDETKESKKNILDLITDAQSMQLKVAELRAGYIAVRDNPQASPEEKFAACEPYYLKKTEQEKLYKEAMDKTELLYHDWMRDGILRLATRAPMSCSL